MTVSAIVPLLASLWASLRRLDDRPGEQTCPLDHVPDDLLTPHTHDVDPRHPRDLAEAPDDLDALRRPYALGVGAGLLQRPDRFGGDGHAGEVGGHVARLPRAAQGRH